MKSCVLILAAIAMALPFGDVNASDPIDEAIQKVLMVKENGEGHATAVVAMKELKKATKSDIPRLLNGLDDANKVSANWLRGVIVSATQKEGDLPVEAILEYFKEPAHSNLGRMLAFDLLVENDSEFANATIPTLADDPSLPLRYMGINWHIEKAEKEAEPAEAIGILGVALDKARDLEQISKIAELMEERGVPVNTQKLLGFIDTWQIVGCFDNKDEGGFDVAYGPEANVAEIDLEATYTDYEGQETDWFTESTSDRAGSLNLVNAIGPIKGVTAYAYATFNAAEARDAEIRIGCINAHKVWLNGKLVISNEIYHNSTAPDKFSGAIKLAEGENKILVKVCQNEQTQPWAQDWQFQLRICDESGKAIEPAPAAEPEY